MKLTLSKIIIWSNNIILPKCKKKPNRFGRFTYRHFISVKFEREITIFDTFAKRNHTYKKIVTLI